MEVVIHIVILVHKTMSVYRGVGLERFHYTVVSFRILCISILRVASIEICTCLPQKLWMHYFF